ncbi:MAG: shikimate dehydrogenase [Parasynechococcus sp.]|nr:shikimate dehydrogenase [Synechococcus sp. AH-601-P18]MDA7434109.1 shikimate dehydrogenase [Synechococcus sp. AH-601-L23]MDB4484578.1 shikimate dehydrogenase [bacterium]
MINGDTGLVGLLGNPVRHSLSPAMHNAALQALQLNWSYLALPCTSQNLQEVLQGLRAVNCRGLNVTIPHKQDVATLCQELSPLAKRLGAVNTLIPIDSGGWHGTNTDVEGFLTPLGEESSWNNRHGVILGCGGSARAVAAGLQRLGLASITVIGRRPEVLDGFIADLHHNDAPLTPCLHSSPILASLIEQADLVVNTTPVGMAQHGDAQAFPLGEAVWSHLQESAVLYDLVYTPRPTAWLRWGQSRGQQCIDGLDMLVQQGAASLRLWSDRNDVPVETMRRAAEAALNP